MSSSNLRSSWLPSATASFNALLGCLLPFKNGFQFPVVDVAHLDEVAEPDAPGVLRGLVQRHLLERGFHLRVLLVEPLLLLQLVRGQGDGQIAGELVPVGLNLGFGKVLEKGGHALVLLGFVPCHDPQAGAADDGVLGRAGNTRPVGQHAGAEFELTGLLEACVAGRRLGVHSHFLGGELGVSEVAPAAVDEDLVLLPVGQLLDVLHMQRAVVDVLGVEPAEAVGLGAHRNVVPGAEILDVDPGNPGRGKTGRVTGGHQLLGVLPHLGPGLGRLGRIQPGFLETVPAVIEHRGGAVEGHG